MTVSMLPSAYFTNVKDINKPSTSQIVYNTKKDTVKININSTDPKYPPNIVCN